MSKENITNDVNIKEVNNQITFIPTDFAGLEVLSYFTADYQNLRSACQTLFNGNMQKDSPIMLDLITAIKKSIFEIQDDIKNIENRLQIIIDINS